jgi:hypothetical protein
MNNCFHLSKEGDLCKVSCFLLALGVILISNLLVYLEGRGKLFVYVFICFATKKNKNLKI